MPELAARRARPALLRHARQRSHAQHRQAQALRPHTPYVQILIIVTRAHVAAVFEKMNTACSERRRRVESVARATFSGVDQNRR